MPGWISLALIVAALLLAGAPASAGAGTLVRYDKSGGLAGLHIEVAVSTTGSVRVDDDRQHAPRRKTLSARRLSALRRALRAARFSTLRRRYESKAQIADGFVETVRYAGRSVTVKTEGRPPARLRKVLALLDALAG